MLVLKYQKQKTEQTTMKPGLALILIFAVYSISSYLYFNRNTELLILREIASEDDKKVKEENIITKNSAQINEKVSIEDQVNIFNKKLQTINNEKLPQDNLGPKTEAEIDLKNISFGDSIGSQIVSYMKEKNESEKKDWLYIFMIGVLQSLPSAAIYGVVAWFCTTLIKKSQAYEITEKNVDLYFYRYTLYKNKESNTFSYKKTFKFGKLQWQTNGVLKSI